MAPGRSLSCETCPSTQTRPSRPIHSPTFIETRRTGHGCSASKRGEASSSVTALCHHEPATGVTAPPRQPRRCCGRRRPRVGAPTMGGCPDPTRRPPTRPPTPGLIGPPAGCCSPPPAATAPGSIAPWSPSRRPWISTDRRSTCARRSSTTEHVVESLEARGAVFVEELDEVPEGATVVFSAHGVAPTVHAEAAARGLKTIDATCPLVTKVHAEARRFADEGYRILLIGHEGHEEVVGTTGEAPEHITLVDGPADGGRRRDRPGREGGVAVADHAVGGRDRRDGGRAARAVPLLVDPPSDDICYATQNRQAAVKEIAPAVRRPRRRRLGQLVELGPAGGGRARRRAPVPPTGSTTPASSTGVVRRCGDRRCHQRSVGAGGPRRRRARVAGRARLRRLEEVHTAEETLVFALPPELRRDLKAAGKA